MSVKRYMNEAGSMVPRENGSWVIHTDYAAIVKALEDLHAVQNGPPLIRDAIVWHEAMQNTEAALMAARGEV